MKVLRMLLLAVLAGSVPGVVLAQTGPPAEQQTSGPATLVADNIFITADRQLVAEGNVEAFQGNTRLRASRITFDRTSGKLTVAGPIRIDQGDGTTLLASAAELDEELRNGLLSGARLVLDQQLQLAAVQITRVRGRYTQMDKAAVTSCHICDDGAPPLWQIRARRVIHDELEKQLYFEGAQFRIYDVPVLYFPHLRLPDPTLKRARGFLIPSVRSTSNLETGLKVPYFIPFGDHADLTLTPYWSPRTNTLEARYRQAFRRGRIDFEGAFTRDELLPDDNRGYLFGNGRFELPRGYRLNFQIQSVSDDAYLVDYGLPDLDRLRSEINLSRTRRDSFLGGALVHFNSLRDGENESLLPSLVADAQYLRRYQIAELGGELRLELDGHSHYRTSNRDVLGRDVNRGTAELEYLRSWIWGGSGVRADWRIGVAADVFDVRQDSNFNDLTVKSTQSTALTVSYPLRAMLGSATHFLEPVMQVAWANVTGDPVPNDESGFVEFDRGNLLALSRFPAKDRREEGLVAAYGVNWARYAPSGWESSATVGQVLRQTADPDFTVTSGLSGTSSDFLLAGQIKFEDQLALTARTIFDDAFSFSKAEFRGDWRNERAALVGTYLWLGADLEENRPERASEVWFDGSYQVTPNWRASANWRYDLTDTRATRAGLGLVYTNECVELDLSLNRRYTSTTSVEPVTSFGVSVALRGFSVSGTTNDYGRSCS